MNPEKMADEAMALCDANSDGQLSASELKAAPGLKFAAPDLDTNDDKKLSRDEILERFQLYVDQKTGLQSFSCKVLKPNGDPLDDGVIRMVPEPFMADFIGEVEGEVIDPSTGLAQFLSEDGLPGVPVGMYRIEITSPTFNVSKKFNEETEIGVEIAPVTNQTAGEVIFKVKGR